MTRTAGSSAPVLVLFDIDGTLLRSDGAGRRAIHHALIEVFGDVGPRDHWFDGKTDPQIVRELMHHVGHGDEHIDAQMQRVFELYASRLPDELRDPEHLPHVMPGVMPLLDALESLDEIVLGLLTGNVSAGAAAKLQAVGIAPERFVVGAYGSDHEMRPELPAIAQQRAEMLTGRKIPGNHVVVIGDTPADVTCGRALGARAIGVATGRYSTHELRSHGAYAVFDDLSDTAAVVNAVLGTHGRGSPNGA
jgi:phosphoglycolate phosphatase-like HAD superfamily hydrolase